MTNSADRSREMSVTRLYHAPRDLVLKMWSDPGLITHWWGPFGFSTTTEHMNFTPGGTWKFVMHGPDGVDYPNFVRYIETGPDQIVYSHGGDGELVDFQVTVTLTEPKPGQTEMTFRSLFPTAEERQRVAEEFGAEEGLYQTTLRLGTYLADVQAEANPFKLQISLPSDTEIRMIRSFRAHRPLVFDAHTKAEMVREWQRPEGFEFTECKFDARPGGSWSMSQTGPGGHSFRFWGEFLEIERPVRTLTTFCFLDFEPHVNSAVFDEANGITKLTITSKFSSQANRDGMMGSGMECGMNQSYAALDALLARLTGATN